VIDVLENALGDLSGERVGSLGVPELDELAEAVNSFYESWRTPALGTDEVRFYSGGWIAGNLELESARQYLYTSLLYAPSVIVHDPIAEWFYPERDSLRSPPRIRAARGGMQVQGAEPELLRSDGYRVFRDQPERSRAFLTRTLSLLEPLAPLIRQGIAVPIPQWQLVRQREEVILSAVRHDVRDEAIGQLIIAAAEVPPRSDHIRGAEVTPRGGIAPSDSLRAVIQNPAYFLNKTLAIAQATASRYVPPAAIDAALLAHRIRGLAGELRQREIDLQVVAAMVAADLPFLGSLDPAKIAAIRRDEAAFEDWRAGLRMTVRAIESHLSQGDAFESEAREVINDALRPRIREVERAVSRSRLMKVAAKDQAIALGIGVAAVTGAAIAIGAPVAPAALAGLGISAVGRWVYSSLFGHTPSGTHGILATLIRK
jgi:hypothetical protein